jgi:hypothetical protein
MGADKNQKQTTEEKLTCKRLNHKGHEGARRTNSAKIKTLPLMNADKNQKPTTEEKLTCKRLNHKGHEGARRTNSAKIKTLSLMNADHTLIRARCATKGTKEHKVKPAKLPRRYGGAEKAKNRKLFATEAVP